MKNTILVILFVIGSNLIHGQSIVVENPIAGLDNLNWEIRLENLART